MTDIITKVKIPYPTEGVIRSDNLDDNVCPENSVNLAVNMNFDRIGAAETRPGVENYADELSEEIRNFGTLNNTYEVPGFKRIEKYITDTELNTFSSSHSLGKIDDTHYIYFHGGTDDPADTPKGYVEILEVDLDTGAVTKLGTPLQLTGASQALYHSCVAVDSTHFINFWSNYNGLAQVFSVNTTTWAVSAVGAPVTFNGSGDNVTNNAVKIDDNHFMNFWVEGAAGKAQVFEVNLGTYAVTAKDSAITFEAAFGPFYMDACSLDDGSRAINFWGTSTKDGFAQVFEANTTSWAITPKSTALTFDTPYVIFNSCASLEDGIHFVNYWRKASFNSANLQVFQVNPTTYAVTAAGNKYSFDGDIGLCNSLGDGTHFSLIYSKANPPSEIFDTLDISYYDYRAQIFGVNPLTFEISTVGNQYNNRGYLANRGDAIVTTAYKILHVYNNEAAEPSGTAASLFFIDGDIFERNYLYAHHGSDVSSWDGTSWTVRRSGINTSQKARFCQFLNRIWMVNGNPSVGNPIMTSDGGDFDLTLVPNLLPMADYIQGGFDGRIWVGDAIKDIVYYTDIVQFTFPSTYSLTFDERYNYIKNFAHQDGDLMTGLVEVPRTLLLFRRNSIYRIYGINSVDAYPAYNVGTYSNESIVKSKDGLYFHHPSGFYKFDYGGQPIEISQRIIDFVEAIPRENYENIIGIWDGNDSVKWSVGQLTVGGVTYKNCQLRYTISTKVWTIYDFSDNKFTAMIRFDDGESIYQIVGTDAGLIGKLDSGNDDFGNKFYFELIDRERSLTDLTCFSKNVTGLAVMAKNGGGVNFSYQTDKSTTNAYNHLGVLDSNLVSILPNISTEDFNEITFRLNGHSSGQPIIFKGIELLTIQNKGLDVN